MTSRGFFWSAPLLLFALGCLAEDTLFPACQAVDAGCVNLIEYPVNLGLKLSFILYATLPRAFFLLHRPAFEPGPPLGIQEPAESPCQMRTFTAGVVTSEKVEDADPDEKTGYNR